jgi:Protein of unknown function (DUF4012)
VTTTEKPPAPGSVERARQQDRLGRFGSFWTARNVVIGLVVVTVWLVGGLVLAADTVQHRAAAAQVQLEAFQVSLKAGDAEAAAAHLHAGRRHLTAAQDAAGSAGVRLVGLLPGVGATVSDLDHLLSAADILTTSAEDALGIYEDFSGPDSTLFQDNQFDLEAVEHAQESAADIEASVGRALGELRQVHGKGPQGAQALEKKQAAITQVAALRADIAQVKPLIKALPSVIGAQRPKTYLVAVMNPAEMRASGGAPLSVAFIRFKKGKMSIPVQGTTSELTNTNQKTLWDKLPGDPWQGVGPQRFVNTNFNPSFPVSAEQMIRAAPSNFGQTVDGVIAIDMVAVSHMLRITGPIETEGYGTLTADNVTHKLVIEAYKNSGQDAASIAARHEVNGQLMTTMMSRLSSGGGLIGKAKALNAAVPGRHLQMYFRDPPLQDLVVEKSLGGAIPLPDPGNLSAVYTQNSNQSKMDVFQQRNVAETVRLRADGSALVRRTVALTNASPPFLGQGKDLKIGYETRWAGSLVINLMPAGAEILKGPAASSPGARVRVSGAKEGVDQDGRTYAQASVLLRPGASTTLSWTYVVRHATAQEGEALRLLDYVVPQAVVNAPTYDLEVIAPKGWAPTAAAGWTMAGRRAAISVPMNAPTELQLLVAPR